MMLAEILGAFGAGSCLAMNYYAGRPIYATLYRTLLISGSAYALGYGIEKVHDKRKRVHLLAIENYKSMFPERVPVKISQTYNDVLQDWQPKR